MAYLPRKGFFGRAMAVFSAASAAASAVETGRRPLDRDLYTIGINPADFRDIHRV